MTSDMDIQEALGIAAHLRKHARPGDDDQSIAALQARTVLALADAVESLRTRNERLGLVRLDAEDRLEQVARRVLDIHRREVWGDDSLDGTRAVCGSCRDSSEEALPWPCPTATAVGVTT